MNLPLSRRLTALALALASSGAFAATTPLSLNYTVDTLTSGLYQYSFNLVLSNASGSWTSGQQWDWLVIGDSNATHPGGFGSDWTWTSVASGTYGTISTGSNGHSGPTVGVGVSALLPGWTPSAVGDSLSWSGTSSVLLPAGSLYWSALAAGGGASTVQFAVANQISAVPEPTSAALVMAGVLGLGLRGRLRKSRAAV
ncbi:PEP-CTERM sorting domain-containing protein [Derxia lacustris]|uniref:PEP-CTERM sorting domain-containing protein n=1 Tax=Derxia lacustris TaxID=764842 RepID=UPI000A17296C|nr:PEP-CTERM sorting domain-containing protein [Derxia lacustris]